MITNFSFLLKFLFFIQIICFVICIELFSNDPDIDRNTTELIASRGFLSQTHYVITTDGYILTMFRIINPFLSNRDNLYPVYLQYGVMGNPEQFLISSAGTLLQNGSYIETNGIVNNCSSTDSVAQTLPFVLSACGYDIWLGNVRGSKYSKHILFNQYTDSQYWAFNLDHFSAYDVAANIQHILRETHSETIGYIGYSLGNSHMFQLMSTQPQYSRIIKPFISLASFVFTGNILSPILRLLEIFEPLLRLIPFRIGGLKRYQPLFGRFFCGNSFFEEICYLVYSLIGGFDIHNLNKSFLPRLWSAFPDGTSTIALAHMGQRMRTNRFNYYDYGQERNSQLYGQSEAPDYNLSLIDSNYIVLMSGTNDFLSDTTDDDILRSQLSVRPYVDYVVPYPYWTHSDFLYANSVGKYINSVMLRILESLHLN